jgi:glycosyltransferase involved in cell wall biosynthesis
VPVVATLHNYNLICAKGSMYRDDHPCFECMDGRLTPALRHSCYHDSIAHTIPLVAGLKMHRAAWQSLVSAYIAISHAMLEPLVALRLPASRIFVKPNFVPPVGKPSWPRDPQVAYVGRLEEAKGVRVLQAAWEQFRAEAPGSPLRLSISGGGPLAGEVADWGSRQPSVDYHGLLPRDAVMDELARSRCSIMPSLWKETFGLVAAESMALGVPPVAAAHGAFPELVTSGANGLLFDPKDIGALASILHRVDQDPDLFHQLGREARTTYEEVFHPGPNLDRLLDIYAFAVANPVTASRAHLG